jgi:hypothetical protein
MLPVPAAFWWMLAHWPETAEVVEEANSPWLLISFCSILPGKVRDCLRLLFPFPSDWRWAEMLPEPRSRLSWSDVEPFREKLSCEPTVSPPAEVEQLTEIPAAGAARTHTKKKHIHVFLSPYLGSLLVIATPSWGRKSLLQPLKTYRY